MNKRDRWMVGQQMPFQFTLLSSSDPHTFKDGQIISTFNKCGFFFCRKGNVEVSLEDKHFQINPGDVYIYMASKISASGKLLILLGTFTYLTWLMKISYFFTLFSQIDFGWLYAFRYVIKKEAAPISAQPHLRFLVKG